MIAAVTVIALALAPLGLGGLMYGRELAGRWGVAQVAGLAIAGLALYLGCGLAGLPVSAVATVLLVVGAVGLWPTLRGVVPGDLIHPALLLPLLFAVAVVVSAPVDYVPYAWDEFSNWAGWSKLMVLEDASLTPAMALDHPGRIPGWPLMMALPGAVLGGWADWQPYAVTVGLHLAFLGLVFDVLRAQGRPVVAWAGLLIFVALEVSWQLAPTNTLIERPLIYALAAVFLLALDAGGRDEPVTWRAALAIGLVAAHAYAVKSVTVTALPSFVLLALCLTVGLPWLRRGRWEAGRTVLAVALMLGPALVVAATWSAVKPASLCVSSLGTLLGPEAWTQLAGERTWTVAAGYAERVWTYYAGYKWPVTVVALGGLGWGLAARRTRPVAVAVGLFVAAYLVSIWWAYVTCEDTFNYLFSSLQRHVRVALRIVHIAGFVLGVLLIGRRLPSVRRRWAVVPLAAVMALAGWKIPASLAEVRGRAGQPDLMARIAAVRAGLPDLLSAIEARPAERPKVLVVTDKGETYERLVTEYYLAGARPGGALHPAEVSSLLLRPDLTGDAVAAAVARADLVWAFVDDPRLSVALTTRGCATDGDLSVCG